METDPEKARGEVLALRSAPAPAPSDGVSAWIEEERRWLCANTSVEPGLIAARASFAHDVLDDRRADPMFMHGDLQAEHVLIADGAVAGVVDWGDAGLGDPLYDLATSRP